MNDTMWIIVTMLAHMSMALLILYITWLTMRGLMLPEHSEGEKHHD
jgi:hypothetical protein